ncbi:hypothetical protein HAZT_HAZT011687 [Hyalella azteca]|uniref:G-protein coupled receptors family 1 profile domain-containing protein n=1 Tax=Hyalella azteca TaxID=294128 RepID=A0A6A0GTL8_HYAAZ|nr:hypothetical protein HAZT_HAZT011687 [Hyalella azteca]
MPSRYHPLALFWVLFGFIFVFGTLGNLIAIIAGVKYRKECSPNMSAMFLFLSNLAVSDFLMVILCVPATFVSQVVVQHWPFGHAACVAVSYSQAVSVFVSAYSLVAISLDRYMAIIYPLRLPSGLGRHQAWVVIAIVWLMALLTCVPVAVHSDLIYYDKSE